jgi:hypothetical protein
MQFSVSLLTSLMFAAHALLGCVAHRTCEHRSAIVSCTATSHAGHACTAHHDGHDGEPAEHEGGSSESCLHSDCSYVKADTQQVDLSADMALLIGTIVAVDPHHEGSFAAAIRDPICRADLTSTQLFVWHCALII